jgi:hypothetical protein
MGSFDLFASQVTGQLNQQLSQVASGLATSAIQALLGGGSTALPQSEFNIDEFRTNITAHGELARSDKFNVYMTVPTVISGGINPAELTLQCEASELPSRDIQQIEYRHYGFIKRIPHMNQYGQATFTFIVTGDMWEKRLFDRWMDVMIPTQTGLVTYPLDASSMAVYETTIQINQYNVNGEPIYSAVLIDAIPTSVSPLSLDWSADQPHKLTVTFNFRKWVSDSTTATVPATDFGRAAGGNVSISTASVNPINNQTNNGQNNGIFGPIPGQAVALVGQLAGSFSVKL